MTSDPDAELLDHLIAECFAFRVFMLQLSLELSRTKEDPEGWARRFIDEMISRIDANDSIYKNNDYPMHEISRTIFDQLGFDLSRLVRLDQHRNGRKS